VGNGRILREGPFDNIWIQPAAGDAGGALGAALFVWHQLLDNREIDRNGFPKGLLLGPAGPTNRFASFWIVGAKYHHFEREEAFWIPWRI
jgi:carbamoyltransferase